MRIRIRFIAAKILHPRCNIEIVEIRGAKHIPDQNVIMIQPR